MTMEQDTTVHNALASLEKIRGYIEQTGSSVEASALVTPEAVSVEAQATATPAVRSRQSVLAEQRIAVGRELRKASMPELMAMFSTLAREKNAGIPLEAWLGGAQGRSDSFGMISNELDPDISKALDSSTGSALIRQDLEPVLYELFVREFPGFERMPKEPANGLTHTWQQTTGFGDAQFMGELGTVTDDRSAYLRQTTNVAIIATRRGVSLKSQFATIQSGSGFNPEQLEMKGGIRALSHRMQYQIFSGHSTDAGGTAANELGLYDPNAFTGLRSILNTSRAKDVDPISGTPEDMRRAFNQAAVEVMQQGGRLGMLWGSPLDKEVFDAQQDKNIRYMSEFVNVGVGVTTNAVNTVFGPVPYGVIIGDAIGSYVPTVLPGGWTTARDVYLLDEDSISMPYLGSAGPTVLDIPIGISGQLTHLFIIFGMWGLAVKAPTYSNKVRVRAT